MKTIYRPKLGMPKKWYSFFPTFKHKHLQIMPLQIAREPLLFYIAFTTNPSLTTCHKFCISNAIQKTKSCMQSIHLSMHFYLTPSIITLQHKTNFKIFSCFLYPFKNQPIDPPIVELPSFKYSQSHFSVIQSTNRNHTPTSLHEEFSKTT